MTAQPGGKPIVAPWGFTGGCPLHVSQRKGGQGARIAVVIPSEVGAGTCRDQVPIHPRPPPIKKTFQIKERKGDEVEKQNFPFCVKSSFKQQE